MQTLGRGHLRRSLLREQTTPQILPLISRIFVFSAAVLPALNGSKLRQSNGGKGFELERKEALRRERLVWAKGFVTERLALK